MTPEDKREVEKLIDRKSGNNFSKRIGDTPTDALQLVPKKYVDSKLSGVAGSNMQVQYNNAGSLAGSGTLIIDEANSKVTVDGTITSPASADLDLIAGTSGHSGDVVLLGFDALTNTSTAGFVYIPAASGTPTGTPANGGISSQAAMRYDTSAHKLWIYDAISSAWKSVTLT